MVVVVGNGSVGRATNVWCWPRGISGQPLGGVKSVRGRVVVVGNERMWGGLERGVQSNNDFQVLKFRGGPEERRGFDKLPTISTGKGMMGSRAKDLYSYSASITGSTSHWYLLREWSIVGSGFAWSQCQQQTDRS